jgi:hypothetical protein
MTVHKLDGKYTVKGHTLDVSVSPCCWMYPGYPLQVQYTSDDGRSRGYVRGTGYSEKTATREQVQKMLDAHLTPSPCEVCRHEHLYNDDVKGHVCEPCFTAKLNAKFDQERAEERDEVRRRDARMKKKGFTHRVTAWVHPNRGDDRQIDIYTKGTLTKTEIRAELKKMGSRVLNDYTVFVL